MATVHEIADQLSEPFPLDAVEWKPQCIKGNRCLAVAYIDCRMVMDRLDQVLGAGNWQTSYRVLKDGVVCLLRAKIGDAWCEHEDVGSYSDQPDAGDRLMAGFSNALKRVAVHLGIGRYLYRLPSVWTDYDEKTKRIVKTPELPPWAMPKSVKEKVRQPKSEREAHTFPEDGQELERRLADYDQDLSEQGLFAPGDLLGHVLDGVSKAGPKTGQTYGPDVRTWPARAIKLAIEATKAFEQQARATEERKRRTLGNIAGKEAARASQPGPRLRLLGCRARQQHAAAEAAETQANTGLAGRTPPASV